MADNTDQERTEQPTPKRVSDARKKGQLARSREWNTFVLLLTGTLGLYVLGDYAMHSLWSVMEGDFRLRREELFDTQALLHHLARDLLTAAKMILPFAGLTLLAALLAPAALGGWNFSTESITPKWDKLNFFKGLSRMLSLQAGLELVKSLLKFAAIVAATVGLFLHDLDRLIGLSQLPLKAAAEETWNLIGICLCVLIGCLAVIAVIDAPFQWWNFRRQLRMTRQEVKDEMRDMEGKPEVKSRIRSLQLEVSRRRMMAEVPKADVIVTNPVHFAVALKYDQAKMTAPTLVAKGKDLIAEQIQRIGREAGVPILPAPPLARALYFSTELNREIPAALYLAVAQVLAYVYQLRAAHQQGGYPPAPPSDLQVPVELQQPPA